MHHDWQKEGNSGEVLAVDFSSMRDFCHLNQNFILDDLVYYSVFANSQRPKIP